MGKSAPQAPAPPDPYKVAQAQTGSNIQSAIAQSVIGNADTVGPSGTTRYTQSGTQTITGPNGERYDIPRYTQTTTLSPEQQGLYDQQAQLGGRMNALALDQTARLSDHLGRPIDASGLPSVENDYSADRTRIEQALFDRINPQLDRDRAALEANLVNQGFQRGTEAFTSAMDQFGRQSNDARLAVTAQGLQEQTGMFGMAQQNRQRALSEMLAMRNQPINEITALMGGGQVQMPNTPQYNSPSIAPAPIGDYTYNTSALQNSQYNQQMQQQNAAMGGLYGLGAAGILGGMKYGDKLIPAIAGLFPSDRRLKENIRDLGVRLVNGLKLYAYRYIGEARDRVGVMADEVLAVRPAAIRHVGGYMAVDYRGL